MVAVIAAKFGQPRAGIESDDVDRNAELLLDGGDILLHLQQTAAGRYAELDRRHLADAVRPRLGCTTDQPDEIVRPGDYVP